MILRIFWNPDEKRIAMFWRLLLQTIFMMLLLLPVEGLAFILQANLLSSIQPANITVMLLLQIVITLLSMFAFVGAVYLAGRWLDRRNFANFGVHLNADWWKDFGFGLALGAVLMAVIFLVEWAAGWVDVVDTFQTKAGLPFIVTILYQLFFFIIVGIREEFMSRGYHLKNMAEGFNIFKAISPKAAVVIATLLSSAVFGILHAMNPNASLISTFNIFLAGIFLATGFLLTGELAIPIGIHITWNFFQGNVFGFPVSGLPSQISALVIQQSGPDIVTGGVFGPEAGLIGIAATILGTVLTVWYVKQRYGTAALLSELVIPEFMQRHQAKLDAASMLDTSALETTVLDEEIEDEKPSGSADEEQPF